MAKFDNYLDEVYGTFEVCGINFRAADILKQLDPIAYDCYKYDFEDVAEECHEDA